MASIVLYMPECRIVALGSTGNKPTRFDPLSRWGLLLCLLTLFM